MAKARAVLVLLSPDDEAKLRDLFISPSDGSFERELTPQARPNVLFEAGLAFGRDACLATLSFSTHFPILGIQKNLPFL
jgi:predicted nucleotide-binding protein